MTNDIKKQFAHSPAPLLGSMSLFFPALTSLFFLLEVTLPALHFSLLYASKDCDPKQQNGFNVSFMHSKDMCTTDDTVY